MPMNKLVLITGGTKGIGKAVAYNLAAAGYDLILTYATDVFNAENVKANIERQFAVKVYLLQIDVSEMQSVSVIANFLGEKNFKLDALVLNAGVTCRDPFEKIAFESWNRVFLANVYFPVFLLQRIVDRVNRGGAIVFTGSLMGIEPHSVSLAYGVSKSAVHALTKNLVKFLSPYSLRVNAVAPGFVDTEWQKDKPVEIRRNIERKIALERFCKPEEVAEVYKMLIENEYFNGEIVVLDGGYSYK